MNPRPRLLPLLALGVVACGDPLPDDVQGYAQRCVRLNAAPIPPYEGDPHAGDKNVYACGVPEDALTENTRPFPAGTMIVKESTRRGEDFPWLVATARKGANGEWRWDEYTRNFADEPPRRILVPQSKCSGCHARARAADFIFTAYER